MDANRENQHTTADLIKPDRLIRIHLLAVLFRRSVLRFLNPQQKTELVDRRNGIFSGEI